MNLRHFNYYLHIWFHEFLTLIALLCCWESTHKFIRVNIMFFTTFDCAWYKIQNIRYKIFYFIWVLKPFAWCMRVMKIFRTNFSHFGLFSDTALDTWLDRRNISSWPFFSYRQVIFPNFFPRIIYFLLHVSAVYHV